jgi:hypothetical protein
VAGPLSHVVALVPLKSWVSFSAVRQAHPHSADGEAYESPYSNIHAQPQAWLTNGLVCGCAVSTLPHRELKQRWVKVAQAGGKARDADFIVRPHGHDGC